jgi:hypothetical protein
MHIKHQVRRPALPLEQTLLDGLAAQLEEVFYLQGQPVIFLEGRVSQACHPRK